MKLWAKYLIIGWSIVSVGISIISYQILKADFIEEDHSISIDFKPEIMDKYTLEIKDNLNKSKSFFVIMNELFDSGDVISKNELANRLKDAKGLEIKSSSKIKDKKVFLYIPLYSFLIWAIPILIFSLLGIFFDKNRKK